MTEDKFYSNLNQAKELYHHGVKGQKWGVRRYTNPDGSLNAAGKKHLGEELKRDYRHNSSSAQPYAVSDNFKNTVINAYENHLTEQDRKQVKQSYDQVCKAAKNTTDEGDFYSSSEYNQSLKDAYKKTYDWFNKNNKTYLNEIISKNHGKKDDLDSFHDFRKTYEGYHDEVLDKYEAAWNKRTANSSARKKENEFNNAYDNYINNCKNAASKLLGEFGNEKLTTDKYLTWTYNDIAGRAINDYYIQRYSKNK